MTINFYTNLSDSEMIGKNITAGDTMTGNLKNTCDMISPSITIEHTGPVDANYCYIPEFGRYYFISRQIVVSENILILDLEVDVLESFKDQILAIPCIIENSSSNNDKYLSGPEWVSTVKTSTYIKNFPSGLNESGEYILITAGG